MTQVRSAIDRPKDQKDTVRRLGLHRMHDTVVKDDRPDIRGMIAKVRHLVSVEEVDEMKLHHLRPAEGPEEGKTRVGRGRAGARGKTAGRGTKGTGARKNVPAYFEGGQMPLSRRVPKLKGFSNPNRVEYAPVNVEVLAKYFDGEVTPAGALRTWPGPQGREGQGPGARRDRQGAHREGARVLRDREGEDRGRRRHRRTLR